MTTQKLSPKGLARALQHLDNAVQHLAQAYSANPQIDIHTGLFHVRLVRDMTRTALGLGPAPVNHDWRPYREDGSVGVVGYECVSCGNKRSLEDELPSEGCTPK